MVDELEVTARVDHARSIIRGNGAPNIEENMRFLAANHIGLLQSITLQCSANNEDRHFWAQQLTNRLPPEKPRSSKFETRDDYIAELRGFTLLLNDSRKYLRVHPGNPDWASLQLMRQAVKRCIAGDLEQTPELLTASLLFGIITATTDGNEGGRNNELLHYIASHLEQVKALMHWISGEELSIAYLEGHLNKATHSTLTGGWL